MLKMRVILVILGAVLMLTVVRLWSTAPVKIDVVDIDEVIKKVVRDLASQDLDGEKLKKETQLAMDRLHSNIANLAARRKSIILHKKAVISENGVQDVTELLIKEMLEKK